MTKSGFAVLMFLSVYQNEHSVSLCLLFQNLKKDLDLDVHLQQFPNKTPVICFDGPMNGVRQKAKIEAELLIPKFCFYKISRKFHLVIKYIFCFFSNGILETSQVLLG